MNVSTDGVMRKTLELAKQQHENYKSAAPDAQTPESGKLSLQDHLREAFGKIGSTRGAWYLKEAWERLDSLERGAAADLAREEMATICERRSAFWGSVKDYCNEAAALDCSRAIRSTITDPAAVKKTLEDAERYRWIRSQPMRDGQALVSLSLMDWNEDGPAGAWYEYDGDELDAAIDAARKGEEG